MKKVLVYFIFVFSFFSLSNANSTTAIATYNFLEIFNEQMYYKTHLEKYDVNISNKLYPSYKMLFDTTLDEKFFQLHKDVVADVTQYKYLGVTNYSDWYNGYGFQCVGLSKVASGMILGGTSNWIKGDLFGGTNGTSFPNKGTILATFNKGKIGVSKLYNGIHTVIYYGMINGVHYVIDQNYHANWQEGVGYIQIHPMNYKKSTLNVELITTEKDNLGTYFSVNY